jgi:putative membrane protein
MKKLLLKWILSAIALALSSLLTGLILPGQFTLEVKFPGILMIFLAVGLLALINATLGALLKLLLVPLNCLTLGLVGLIINAAIFFWVGNMGLGFKVDGFFAAFVGSILFSACTGVLQIFVKDDKKNGDDED